MIFGWARCANVIRGITSDQQKNEFLNLEFCCMANNKSDRPDKMYVSILTVRLSEEEYAQLEKMTSDDIRPISLH